MYTRVHFASATVHIWLSTNNTIFEGQAQYYINHLAQPAGRAGTAASIYNPYIFFETLLLLGEPHQKKEVIFCLNACANYEHVDAVLLLKTRC